LWQCKELGQAVVHFVVAMQGIGWQAVVQFVVAMRGIGWQAVVQLVVAMQEMGGLVLVQLVESLCYNAEGTLDIVIGITIPNTLWPWGRLSL